MVDNQLKTNHNHLKRALSNRQLQLIAIGGTIGTSLFLGTAKTISIAGPSIIIDYIIAGIVMFLSMRVLGEMLLSKLEFKSFRDIAAKYLGNWAGYLVGWMYWGFWIVTGMQDSVAVSVYIKDFLPNIPSWLPGIMVVLLIFALNSVAVNVFGELEFWLSIIKIVAICTLIAIGLYMICSGEHFIFEFKKSDGTVEPLILQSSVNNLFNDGGFMPHGVMGFLLGFQMAFLAYTGVEAIGTTAAEIINPQKVLPKAVNAIPIRIGIFYVGAVFVILCAVPWDKVTNLEGSPFVNMFKAVGIPSAAAVMTFVLISAAVSGANSGLYATSRMLYGLALDAQAPKIFSHISKRQIPFYALMFGVIVISIPVIVVSFFAQPMNAFVIFAAWATGCVLIVWILVLLSYFVYIVKYNDLHQKSIFKSPFGRIGASIALFFFGFIVIMMLFDNIARLGLILTVVSLLLMLILYRFVVKKHITNHLL